ncbi:MAG: hypothetical protein VR70_06245 [Rhodospirillaceae bacterium BRH_c57]|nr:MAG: hypothetical protein VR70_06245 [Rhodospirillaceae bacterium BRH_c57]
MSKTTGRKTYTRANKPLVWFPFAGGGLVAALMLPVMIFVTGIAVPLGLIDAEALSYDRVYAFAANPLGKIILFGVLVLPLWHAAHRFRMTIQDLGARTSGSRSVVAALCYGFGMVFTLLCLAALLSFW